MARMLMLFTSLLLSYSVGAQGISAAESKLMIIEGKRLWQSRDQREILEEALSKFDLAHAGDSKNTEVLAYLARGNFLLGEYFAVKDDEKMRFYEKAREYGDKGLALNEDYKKVLAKKGPEDAIDKLKKADVPLLFWTAASLGKWAKANGVFSSLKYKGQILAMIKKVEELEPDFFHASVPRYWGGFYAVAPSIAGGDMKKSKKKFEEAIKKAPEYLGTRVLFAELYWVKEENKKEFKKELEFVLAQKQSIEELAPENRMEKKKAEMLLEKMDDLF